MNIVLVLMGALFVQSVALAVVALFAVRALCSSGSDGHGSGPDSVGGEMLHQVEEQDSWGADPTIGFLPPRRPG